MVDACWLNGIHVDVADGDAYTLIIALACGQLDYRDVAPGWKPGW